MGQVGVTIYVLRRGKWERGLKCRYRDKIKNGDVLLRRYGTILR